MSTQSARRTAKTPLAQTSNLSKVERPEKGSRSLKPKSFLLTRSTRVTRWFDALDWQEVFGGRPTYGRRLAGVG